MARGAWQAGKGKQIIPHRKLIITTTSTFYGGGGRGVVKVKAYPGNLDFDVAVGSLCNAGEQGKRETREAFTSDYAGVFSRSAKHTRRTRPLFDMRHPPLAGLCSRLVRADKERPNRRDVCCFRSIELLGVS